MIKVNVMYSSSVGGRRLKNSLVILPNETDVTVGKKRLHQVILCCKNN